MSYGIRKVWSNWCWTFTQHTSFYLTSYVTDMNYITHWRFSSTFINRSIVILLEFWRFCQSREHRFPPYLDPKLSTMWYDYSIVTFKFQYLWCVWTSSVQGRDCDSCTVAFVMTIPKYRSYDIAYHYIIVPNKQHNLCCRPKKLVCKQVLNLPFDTQ